MRLIIYGSVPEGKKSLQSSPMERFAPSSRFECWRDEAIASIRKQLQNVRLTRPSSISVRYYCADDKRRTPLTILNTVLFVLREAGIVAHERIFGGGQGTQLGFVHGGISGRPRVEIEINECKSSEN